MDYSLCILSVVTFIERRVRSGMDTQLLEKVTGFSYRHLREVFKERTKMTLARYTLSRRVAHAAFDMAHTEKSLTDIAGEYGFDTYDTFSRAFRRETGVVPSLFEKPTSMWDEKDSRQAPMALPYWQMGLSRLQTAIRRRRQ